MNFFEVSTQGYKGLCYHNFAGKIFLPDVVSLVRGCVVGMAPLPFQDKKIAPGADAIYIFFDCAYFRYKILYLALVFCRWNMNLQ